MERDIIKLTNDQWQLLCQEEFLEINEEHVDIVENKYQSSGRHTERWSLVFKIDSMEKYFRVNYETSVKDSMGWNECNYGNTEAVEVFPKEVVTIIYE